MSGYPETIKCYSVRHKNKDVPVLKTTMEIIAVHILKELEKLEPETYVIEKFIEYTATLVGYPTDLNP